MNYWTLLSNKAFELSSYYGVDPLIFGLLYVGTIPFLWLSVSWIIRCAQKKQPMTIPIVISVLCYTGVYIYVIFAGQNIPFWVYCVLVGIIGFVGFQFHTKVTRRLSEVNRDDELKSGTGEIIRR